MYQTAKTVEQARANCEEARRRLLSAPDGSQRQRDAMVDLKLFESMAASLAYIGRADPFAFFRANPASGWSDYHAHARAMGLSGFQAPGRAA